MRSLLRKEYPTFKMGRWFHFTKTCPLNYYERLIYSLVARRRCRRATIVRTVGLNKATVTKYCNRLQSRKLLTQRNRILTALPPEGETISWFVWPVKLANGKRWQDRLAPKQAKFLWFRGRMSGDDPLGLQWSRW